MDASKQIRPGSSITVESAAICLPSMGGYPEHLYRGITVLEDGYRLTGTVADAIHNPISSREKHIEKGFFARSSLEEIARMLNMVMCYHDTTAEDIVKNTGLMELIEYDRQSIG